MSLTFHWFLPTYGDSRNLIAGGHGTAMAGDRPATLRYLNQVAAAAEQAGFESVLTPTGAWCEDAWLTTAMLIQETEKLKFLVALRPGLMSPTLAAQMASTFQWQSEGRLLLNVVTGGEPQEQLAYGDSLNKADRYARCGEFLSVVRQLWAGRRSRSASAATTSSSRTRACSAAPIRCPPIYFGGSSAEAGPVAADHADTYLTWGEPLAGGRREGRLDPQAGQGARPLDVLRHPAARHLARHQRAGLGRGRPAAARHPRDRDRAGADRLGQERVRGPEADARPAPRQGRATCARSRWRRTCGRASGWCAVVPARRWWARTRRSPSGSASTPTSASTTSSSPATPTSRRPGSSPRASYPPSPGVA